MFGWGCTPQQPHDHPGQRTAPPGSQVTNPTDVPNGPRQPATTMRIRVRTCRWGTTVWWSPIEGCARRRPTLPRSLPRSTIGAEGLSFRVRDGTGRFPLRYGRRNSMEICVAPDHTHRAPGWGVVCVVGVARISGTAQWTRSMCGQVLGLLVPVSCTGYPASTSGLSTRWSTGGLNPHGVGDLILKQASRLDAFSGYPCRT